MPGATNEALALPLLGRVAAGQPIGAAADIEREVIVDPHLFHPRPHYLLRVRGDSMRDDGIFDGDLIAVHRTPEADDNQIVVARLDGELTVKRLKRRKDRITLLPRNPDHAPIEVPPGTVFAIEGVYCGQQRIEGDDGGHLIPAAAGRSTRPRSRTRCPAAPRSARGRDCAAAA